MTGHPFPAEFLILALGLNKVNEPFQPRKRAECITMPREEGMNKYTHGEREGGRLGKGRWNKRRRIRRTHEGLSKENP